MGVTTYARTSALATDAWIWIWIRLRIRPSKFPLPEIERHSIHLDVSGQRPDIRLALKDSRESQLPRHHHFVTSDLINRAVTEQVVERRLDLTTTNALVFDVVHHSFLVRPEVAGVLLL